MRTKQRGSGWSIKAAYNLYKLFGYKFVYYLMYASAFFYYLKAKNVEDALSIYYEQIGLEFTKKRHFEHLRHFAVCMCDRFISLADPKDYTFEIQNEEYLNSELEKGGILLLSHFGGWSTSANCFGHLNLKMNVVMKEVLMRDIKKIEESIQTSGNSHLYVIDTGKGGIASTLEIAEALRKNELVSIMADRPLSRKTAKKINFFGKDALFNKNPFDIAYKMNKPLIAIYTSYIKPQTYKIDYVKIEINKENDMQKEVSLCMKTYVQKLESNIREYPQGWFNLYNFWETKIED